MGDGAGVGAGGTGSGAGVGDGAGVGAGGTGSGAGVGEGAGVGAGETGSGLGLAGEGEVQLRVNTVTNVNKTSTNLFILNLCKIKDICFSVRLILLTVNTCLTGRSNEFA